MDWKKLGLAVALLAIAGVVVWAVATRLGGDGAQDTSGDGAGVVAEDPAASAVTITGTTLDGETFDLEDYRGKPVVINFWASWCGYCGVEMPDLLEFAEAHPEAVVLGVAVNDERDAALAFAREHAITFPSVYDPDGTVFAQFESQGLPTTVFLDKDLRLKEKIIGATDLQGFEAGLRAAQ